LETELHEKEDEQEPLALKIETLNSLVLSKDKEISILKLQIE
jgi:hypothetical protein